MALNLNTATYEELMSLENIGKTRAGKIVQFRNNSGAIKIDDLAKITSLDRTHGEQLLANGVISLDNKQPERQTGYIEEIAKLQEQLQQQGNYYKELIQRQQQKTTETEIHFKEQLEGQGKKLSEREMYISRLELELEEKEKQLQSTIKYDGVTSETLTENQTGINTLSKTVVECQPSAGRYPVPGSSEPMFQSTPKIGQQSLPPWMFQPPPGYPNSSMTRSFALSSTGISNPNAVSNNRIANNAAFEGNYTISSGKQEIGFSRRSHKGHNRKKDTRRSRSSSHSSTNRRSSSYRHERYQSTSDDCSSSDCFSDSDEECDPGIARRGKRITNASRHLGHGISKSPPRPKLQVYSGEGNWESFIFQFKRQVKRNDWSNKKAKDRLFDCLKDKALDFAREMRKLDFQELVRKLGRRFSNKEAPIAARRQLNFIRQKDGESYEEFSQRVHFLAMDGHPGAKEDTINQMAVESFLRGCRDKEAARSAMDKNPKSIYKALKYIKAAINNQKALFGSRPSYSSKQVSFAECPSDIEVRSVGKDNLPNNEIVKLRKMVEDLARKFEMIGQKSPSSQKQRTRSPTPNRKCYACNEEGHFANECDKNKSNQ